MLVLGKVGVKNGRCGCPLLSVRRALLARHEEAGALLALASRVEVAVKEVQVGH